MAKFKKRDQVFMVTPNDVVYEGRVAYVNQHMVKVHGGRPGAKDQTNLVFNAKTGVGTGRENGWVLCVSKHAADVLLANRHEVPPGDESFSDMKNDEALLANGRPKEEPHVPTPEEQRDQLRVQAAEASWMVYVEWLCNRYGLPKEVRAPVSKLLKDLAIDESEIEKLLGSSTTPVHEEEEIDEEREEEEVARSQAFEDEEDEGGGGSAYNDRGHRD